MIFLLNIKTSRIEEVEVVASAMTDNTVEITEGLKEGDYLITAGVNYIYKGQLAKPWEPQED